MRDVIFVASVAYNARGAIGAFPPYAARSGADHLDSAAETLLFLESSPTFDSWLLFSCKVRMELSPIVTKAGAAFARAELHLSHACMSLTLS